MVMIPQRKRVDCGKYFSQLIQLSNGKFSLYVCSISCAFDLLVSIGCQVVWWERMKNDWKFDEFWLSCGLKLEEGFCYRHANASTPICKFTHAIIPILTHAVYFFTLHCVCHGTIISRMEINVIWSFLMNWTSMINIYLNTLFKWSRKFMRCEIDRFPTDYMIL